jgi:hypothetical protein
MIFSKIQVQFRIRIRIHNLELPDPAQSFGSLRIRIHNIDFKGIVSRKFAMLLLVPLES